MLDAHPTVTLQQVAAHAGVSLATASRAFNGSTRKVNEELQRRVLASAKALNYSANAQAQAMARGTSRAVAIIVGDIADPYFSSIAAGVIRVAERHNLVVTLAVTGNDAGREAATLAALRGQRPQAVIVASSRRVDVDADAIRAQELAGIEALGGRVITVGVPATSPGQGAIVVRNREASAELAHALHDRGYRDFLVLSGDPRLVTPVERAQGFVDALTEHGIHLSSAQVCESDFSRDGGFRAMSAVLEAGGRPECIFAVTDVMAVGAMAALREHGLTPGIDVAVAGFDDIEMLQDVTPALTTVALPLTEIGERALELALADSERDALENAFGGRVVLRASTPVRAERR